MSNTFGTYFRLTTFGESHGQAIGGIVDGMPPGLMVDTEAINAMLARRRPGQSATTTQRREVDTVELLSGTFEGVTTGTPIGFIIRNNDAHSNDYEHLRDTFRPCHADFTYTAKYGLRDYRGGGRSSARETASRVVAGALAMQVLQPLGIRISAWASSVGGHPQRPGDDYTAIVADAASRGDSVGAVVSCRITGMPVGLGEPVFGKFQAQLAAAMMSIPAAKGFDYGDGFDSAAHFGSEMIDTFISNNNGHITTLTNHSGGIQGGITNGMPVEMRVAFKPIATLMRDLASVDSAGRPILVKGQGRHDPCVVPRVIPVVEAMGAIVTLDMIMADHAALKTR